MAEEMPADAAAPIPRKRKFQFRLVTLLVVVLVTALAMYAVYLIPRLRAAAVLNAAEGERPSDVWEAVKEWLVEDEAFREKVRNGGDMLYARVSWEYGPYNPRPRQDQYEQYQREKNKITAAVSLHRKKATSAWSIWFIEFHHVDGKWQLKRVLQDPPQA